MATLGDILDRLALIQADLVADSVAKGFSEYTQDGKPYWTNASALSGATKISADVWRLDWMITQRLYHSNVGQQYEGNAERAIADILNGLVTFFITHQRLAMPSQSLASLDGFDPEGLSIQRANHLIGGESGDVRFLECVITCPMIETVQTIGD